MYQRGFTCRLQGRLLLYSASVHYIAAQPTRAVASTGVSLQDGSIMFVFAAFFKALGLRPFIRIFRDSLEQHFSHFVP